MVRRSGAPRRALTLLVLTAPLWGGSAAAAIAEPAAPPRVLVRRLSAAPRLDDFAGMEPQGVAREMARVEGLVARLPRDGEPFTERTVVYLGYDDTSLYAAFVCFDRDPSAIRAHLNGRDRIPDADDSIALQLDTFRDLKHAVGFQANALGVQQDGLWTEGKGWDLSFDAVWESEARLTDQGYLVLLRVPFKSLRFSADDIQRWGLLVYRGLPRRSEEGFWPGYSTRIAGRMSQAAVLEGLQGIRPGRNAQVVPYASARSFRVLDASSGERPLFRRDTAAGQIGADAKVVVRGGLALDLAVNPDFSQVESDEPQVTVNNRFETFFPERRPFFLENASFFDTPIPLVFTRRITDPRLGARLTGRVGRYALGALVAEDRLVDGSAFVGILRVNADVGPESTVGAFLSNREADGPHNRVAGIDARLKIARDWVGAVQAARSDTRVAEGRPTSGPAWRLTVQRSGRRLNYGADFNDRSAGFRSALGFIDRVDVRSLDQTLSYRLRPTGSWLLSWGPDLVASQVWDRGVGGLLDRVFTPKLTLEGPGLTMLSVYRQDAQVRLRPGEPSSLAAATSFSHDRWGAELATSFTRALTLGVKAAKGRGVNLAPAAGVTPSAADVTELNVSADLRPSPRLTVATSYLFQALDDPARGTRIFTDQIARARINYQFTRALSARAIVQHDRLAVDPAATSLGARRRLNLDLLLTFLPSPGTAVHIGVNDDLEDFDPSLTLTPRGLLRAPDGSLRSRSWQVFAKASYLVRL